MPTLTDIMTINQQELKTLLNFNIKHGFNLMIFGPSGGGKTHIAKQAAAKCDAQLAWCNLAVNERPDLQGWPKVSSGDIAEFQMPQYMPVPETRNVNEIKSLSTALEVIKNQAEHREVAQIMEARLADLTKLDVSTKLNGAMEYLHNMQSFNKNKSAKDNFVKYVQDLDNFARTSQQKIVLMFDEGDKAPHDVLQPLLEILQFHTLNGRKLAIHACIITCNLPDEKANTEELSHAITNRCFIYKMDIDFDIWKKWAIQNGVHPMIVGFLAQNVGDLLRPPNNHDSTAYAHPSPRAWTEASTALYCIEKDEEHKNDNVSDLSYFKTTIIAGKVGQATALKLEVWLKHYKELDPLIQKLVESGINPDWTTLGLEQRIVFAISAVAHVNSQFKPHNEQKIKQYVQNVFSWIDTIGVEDATAGIRNALDLDLATKYGIHDMELPAKVFLKIKVKTDN